MSYRTPKCIFDFLFFVSQAIANHPKVVSRLKIRQEGKTIDLTYHVSN
ncbi:hypothetical protein [Okeania sp. KiyG1]|nr:hypothetical protein [Okeania sp. KiyG1]